MTSWERFSPAWWAAWTFALHRPGRLDDEEIPEDLAPYACPVWWHYAPWVDAHGREGPSMDTHPWEGRAKPQNRDPAGRRPDWPTMLGAQTRCERASSADDSRAIFATRR